MGRKEADDLLALGVDSSVVFNLYRLSGLLVLLAKDESVLVSKARGSDKQGEGTGATKFARPLMASQRDVERADTALMKKASEIGEPVVHYLEAHRNELEDADDATLTGLLKYAGHPELAAQVLKGQLSEEERLLLMATAIVALETRSPQLLDAWSQGHSPRSVQSSVLPSLTVVRATRVMRAPTTVVVGQ